MKAAPPAGMAENTLTTENSVLKAWCRVSTDFGDSGLSEFQISGFRV